MFLVFKALIFGPYLNPIFIKGFVCHFQQGDLLFHLCTRFLKHQLHYGFHFKNNNNKIYPSDIVGYWTLLSLEF